MIRMTPVATTTYEGDLAAWSNVRYEGSLDGFKVEVFDFLNQDGVDAYVILNDRVVHDFRDKSIGHAACRAVNWICAPDNPFKASRVQV